MYGYWSRVIWSACVRTLSISVRALRYHEIALKMFYSAADMALDASVALGRRTRCSVMGRTLQHHSVAFLSIVSQFRDRTPLITRLDEAVTEHGQVSFLKTLACF